MPISVPGPNNHARQRGFSLLEVLIVLAIIGIASAAVGVSAFSGSDIRTLRQDALRLSLLFSVAQAEARKGGSPIIWEYDTKGYGFARAPRDLFLPTGMARHTGPALASGFADTSSLRSRAWAPDHPIEVRVDPPASNQFNTEWISGPLSVDLHDGTNTVRIVRAGNGQYRVLP